MVLRVNEEGAQRGGRVHIPEKAEPQFGYSNEHALLVTYAQSYKRPLLLLFFCFICIQISFLISTFRNKKRGEYSFTKECSFFFSVLIFFDFWISVQGGEDVEKTMVPQHSTCVIRMTSSNGPLTERIEKGQEWTPANPRNSRWLLYS